MYVCFKVGTGVANHDRRVIWANDDGPIDREGKQRSEFHKANVEADTSKITSFINEYKNILKRSKSVKCPPCDEIYNPCVEGTKLSSFGTNPMSQGTTSCSCKKEPYCEILKNGTCTVNVTWLVNRIHDLKRFCL